jgi:hypothetical protein
VLWPLRTITATHPVATVAAARPPPYAASTQGKPTFDVASGGIPDTTHASVSNIPAVATATVAAAGIHDCAHASASALPAVVSAAKATAAFSIHNNEDGWGLDPLGPRDIGNAADTGATGQLRNFEASRAHQLSSSLELTFFLFGF